MNEELESFWRKYQEEMEPLKFDDELAAFFAGFDATGDGAERYDPLAGDLKLVMQSIRAELYATADGHTVERNGDELTRAEVVARLRKLPMFLAAHTERLIAEYE